MGLPATTSTCLEMTHSTLWWSCSTLLSLASAHAFGTKAESP
jgi:hypothetical protein